MPQVFDSVERTVPETDGRGPIAGRTCVVTGGSRGIGRAISRELTTHGANVVVHYDRSPDAALSLLDELASAEGDVVAIDADLTDEEQVTHLGAQTHERFGPVDVLVNNASVTADAPFEEMTREDWDRVVSVNLDSVFDCTTEFYDDLRASDHGRLVNVSSVVGQRGNYGQANYASTKTGVLGFTRTLALELAPHGTTANCVAPGFTETETPGSNSGGGEQSLRDRIPLGRFAAPAEIAATVRFLVSEDAEYITGQVIGINGGLHW